MGACDWTPYFLSDYTFSAKAQPATKRQNRKKPVFIFLLLMIPKNGALKIAEDVFINRYNIRSKVDYDVFSWLTVGNNTLFSMTERKEPSYLSIADLYDVANQHHGT